MLNLLDESKEIQEQTLPWPWTPITKTLLLSVTMTNKVERLEKASLRVCCKMKVASLSQFYLIVPVGSLDTTCRRQPRGAGWE